MARTENLAFIGLGRMGWQIAKHLRVSNPDLPARVFDVAPQAMNSWVAEHGGNAATSLADAATDAQLIFSSLPADKELLAVANAIIPGLHPGAIWIDHSTTSAQAAREVYQLMNQHGSQFLDAPVSGGVDGARAGSLTVMVGGDRDAFDVIEPIAQAYAGRITYMGNSGAGQITKMTNQICVVGLCQALAEGLSFAERAGLDVERVVQVMLQGSSVSWQMQNRAAQMLASEYDFGFSNTLMRKDVSLVLNEAQALQLPLPVTAMVAEFLDEVNAMGGANWDWCSLMERQRGRTSGA